MAEAIGGTLAANGAQVDVRPAVEVESVEPYDAVVIGSPMFHSQWMVEVHKFVKQQRRQLAEKPVAYFLMGVKLFQAADEPLVDVPLWIDPAHGLVPKPSDELGEGERAQTIAMYLDPILTVSRGIKPVCIAFFKGRFVEEFTGEEITDYRNWEAIRAWAEEISGKL